jgi:large subunit ribosomal protein L21
LDKEVKMFAVVDISGQQFKVTEKKKYYVPRLKDETDAEITFDKVLLIGDDNSTKIGSPFVDGITVTAKVLGHTKDEKVIVFKKKRRTGYQKSNGHRQQLSQIEILKIG